MNGRHLRIASAAGRDGRSVQFAQDVDDVDDTIADLRTTLLIVGGLSICLAALLALFVARASLRPVARLTRAAERVATTQDLAASIDVRRRDELGRLASSLNAMLTALDMSREQQRELIRDASHELQTPLTSLRTNVEVLAGGPSMPEDERRRLLADVSQQVAELTALMDNLVELARDTDTPTEETTEIDLDRVVTAAVDRAGCGHPTSRSSSTSSRRAWKAGDSNSSVRSSTCSTTRANGARPANESRSACTTGRSPFGIMAPASTPRTSPASSTASTERRQRGRCRVQDWGSRSCVG